MRCDRCWTSCSLNCVGPQHMTNDQPGTHAGGMPQLPALEVMCGLRSQAPLQCACIPMFSELRALATAPFAGSCVQPHDLSLCTGLGFSSLACWHAGMRLPAHHPHHHHHHLFISTLTIIIGPASSLSLWMVPDG